MNLDELKCSLQNKLTEFDVAMELGRPHADLKLLYSQIKELQYQLTMAQATAVEVDSQTATYSHFSTKKLK